MSLDSLTRAVCLAVVAAGCTAAQPLSAPTVPPVTSAVPAPTVPPATSPVAPA